MNKKRFLEVLSKDFPNIRAASAEITNLNVILALPKGRRQIGRASCRERV